MQFLLARRTEEHIIPPVCQINDSAFSGLKHHLIEFKTPDNNELVEYPHMLVQLFWIFFK